MIEEKDLDIDAVSSTEVADVVLSGLSDITLAGPKKKAVCLSMRLGLPGIKKKISSDSIESKSDKTMLDVFKHILDSPELNNVRKVDVQIRQLIQKRTYSTKYLHPGIYLVPVGLVEEVDTKLNEFKGKREEAIEAFIQSYPAAINEAKDRLKDLFNESDYPTADNIRGCFRFSVRYVDFGVPGTLQEVSKALFKQEKEKAEKDWENATEEIRQALRLGMAGVVDKFCERLSPDVDGKPKRFKASTVDHLNDFLTTFEHRDLTNDEDLKKLVESAKEALKGATPAQLRAKKDIRTKVLDSFNEIKSKLDSLEVQPAGRKITFEEE